MSDPNQQNQGIPAPDFFEQLAGQAKTNFEQFQDEYSGSGGSSVPIVHLGGGPNTPQYTVKVKLSLHPNHKRPWRSLYRFKAPPQDKWIHSMQMYNQPCDYNTLIETKGQFYPADKWKIKMKHTGIIYAHMLSENWKVNDKVVPPGSLVIISMGGFDFQNMLGVLQQAPTARDLLMDEGFAINITVNPQANLNAGQKRVGLEILPEKYNFSIPAETPGLEEAIYPADKPTDKMMENYRMAVQVLTNIIDSNIRAQSGSAMGYPPNPGMNMMPPGGQPGYAPPMFAQPPMQPQMQQPGYAPQYGGAPSFASAMHQPGYQQPMHQQPQQPYNPMQHAAPAQSAPGPGAPAYAPTNPAMQPGPSHAPVNQPLPTQVMNPTPVAPAPVVTQPVAPAPVAPAPTPVAPTPVAPAPQAVAPQPVTPQPVTPQPVQQQSFPEASASTPAADATTSPGVSDTKNPACFGKEYDSSKVICIACPVETKCRNVIAGNKVG